MGVVGAHPRSRSRRKMWMPALTGQAAADLERKWGTVSPQMEFFLLSRLPGVCLGVSRFSGVGQTIQEMGRCNRPPCLRNRLFPKSVHPVPGVLGVPDSVAIDLEKLDAREWWILESRVDQQGGTEVGPLPVQPLISRILSGAGSHGFLRSVEITQESSSRGGREICHKPCDWGGQQTYG